MNPLVGQLAAVLAFALPVSASDETLGERLDRLESENGVLQNRIEALADEIERLELGNLLPPVGAGVFGLGPAASKVYGVSAGAVSIGGYGEFLYESIDSQLDDGSRSGATDTFDALRGVLYFGYKFNEKWVFNSEIEYEHGTTGSVNGRSGSASLEFATIDYLHSDEVNGRAGLLLVPMGFINELHEPTTFYSAQRPVTEQRIIPSTWRENGAGAFGEVGDFSYRAYVVNGLNGEEFSGKNGLRGGRQKGNRALADDFAFVGRLDYTGQPGLLAGVSAYQGNSGQRGNGLGDTSTTIVEGHVEYSWQALRLRGLYAMANVDDTARLASVTGETVGEDLEGYYVEAGYDVMQHILPGSDQSLIPFFRYESIDTQASVAPGLTASPANDREFMTFGVAYYPHSQIVFKLDFRDEDNAAGTGLDQINFAMGYIF